MGTAAWHPAKADHFPHHARAPTPTGGDPLDDAAARTPQCQHTVHPAPRFVSGGLTLRHSAAGRIRAYLTGLRLASDTSPARPAAGKESPAG